VGFGVLIARGEGYRMPGNLWDTYIYPRRSPGDCVLVRAIYGGGVDEGVGAMDEGTVLALAREEVARMYGLDAAPVFSHVERWPRAIPQYELGHPARVKRIEAALEAVPNLWITGNGLRGISFADAATDGVRTGESVARRILAS
jgi:oxygen-dependent protoporphyrinogen oxidase